MNVAHAFYRETERLWLRAMDINDADFIFTLLNTPGWLQYIGDRGVKSKKDAQKYITERILTSYASNGFGMYAMVLKGSGEVIGTCGLIKRDGIEGIDVGFAILPDFVQKGYTYEAAVAIIDFAATYLKIQQIFAITTTDNKGSICILRKLGMQFKKVITLPNDTEGLMLFERWLF